MRSASDPFLGAGSPRKSVAGPLGDAGSYIGCAAASSELGILLSNQQLPGPFEGFLRGTSCSAVIAIQLSFLPSCWRRYGRVSSAPEVVRRGASAFSSLCPHNVRERSAVWRYVSSL